LYDFAFAALTVSYPKFTVYEDDEKGLKAISQTHEMYGAWRWMESQTGAIGTREFGGKVKMPTSEFAMAPALLRPAVESEEDVWKLELPDVRTAGAIPVMMQYAKEQEKRDWPIVFSSMGPLSTVGYITGVEQMCRWMVREPELVHRLCRLVTDFVVALAEYWVDTFGQPERIIP